MRETLKRGWRRLEYFFHRHYAVILLLALTAQAAGGFAFDAFGNLMVNCQSGCSGGGGAGAPLPGNGSTAFNSSQSVGVQFNNGTAMVPVSPSSPLPVTTSPPGAPLPGNLSSTAGSFQSEGIQYFNGATSMVPVSALNPLPVLTPPPNTVSVPLPGNATAVAGANQNVGNSFFDGATHMVPVSPASPLPVTTPNPVPTGVTGGVRIEGSTNGTSVTVTRQLLGSTTGTTINDTYPDQEGTAAVSCSSSCTGSTTVTVAAGVNSKSIYMFYGAWQNTAASAGSPTYQAGYVASTSCPSNGAGVVYFQPGVNNIPAGATGNSTFFAGQGGSNANALAGGISFSSVPFVLPLGDSLCGTLTYAGTSPTVNGTFYAYFAQR